MKYLTNRMGGFKHIGAPLIAIIFCCYIRSFKILLLMDSSLSMGTYQNEQLSKYL